MPLAPADSPAGPALRVGVHASVAVELEWALAAGQRADFRDHPTLSALYDGDPALQERVRAMWGDDTALDCCGVPELVILAQRAGLLLSDDADALIGRLDAAATLPLDEDEYPMTSETAEDRRVVLTRLARLRRSATLRRDYVALVRDVWAGVRADWARYGRGAVAVAVEARREALARGTDWHEVVRGGCDFGPLLDQCVAGLGPGGEVAVIPAFFTHRGLLFDLPGLVVVGVRTDTTGVEARARTEHLARRLKAMADPTRLAILDALCRGPRTVTELATAFALAQPTVSNHVRVMRQAGLVSDVRDGTRRNLVVRPHAAEQLLASLQDVLVGARAAHGAHDVDGAPAPDAPAGYRAEDGHPG